MEPKIYVLTLDLFRTLYADIKKMTYGDANLLKVQILNNGELVNLAGVTTASLAVTRPDKVVVDLQGTIEGNEVSFLMNGNELAVEGYCNAVVQLYDAEDRVSSVHFKIEALKDPTANGFVPSEKEQTLIQIVLNDGPLRIQEAIDAALAANNAAQLANESASTANDAATNANNKATLADQKATLADEKAGIAQTAATNADQAATNANNKATLADQKAALANEKAGIAGTAASNADQAATNANDKATLADEKATLADEKASLADEKASLANTAANNADNARIALQTEIDEYFAELQAGADAQTAIYGVYHNGASNPTLERIKGAVGKIAAVGTDGSYIQNDFDQAQIFGEIGEVTDSLGNVFVRIPKHYFRHRQGRNADGTLWQIDEISKTQHAGFNLYPCFYDFENNVELPYVDVGKYLAGQDGTNRMTSKKNEYPRVSQSIVAFRSAAVANNTDGRKGYQLWDIHAVDMLQRLFMIEFATLHSQSVMYGFGTGQYSESHTAINTEAATNQVVLLNAYADLYRVGQSVGIGTSRGGNQITPYRTITAINVVDVDSKAIVFDGEPLAIAAGNFIYNTAYKTGSTDNVAASSGSPVSNTEGKFAMKYRGVESLYGDVFQFVDGVNINEYQAWVCKDARFYASNLFAAPYEQLGYINQSNEGYAKEMGFDPFNPTARFPVQVGAGTSTWYSDYYYRAAGQRVALFGGAWASGAYAGLFFWYLYYSSSTAALNLGARLLKKAL